jgi:hypothetical protein
MRPKRSTASKPVNLKNNPLNNNQIDFGRNLMHTPQHSLHDRILRSPQRWLLLLISLTCLTTSRSQAAVPKAAFVTSVSGSSILLERPGHTSVPAAAWLTQLRDYKENLFVPQNTTAKATLTGISAKAGEPVKPAHLIGPTAYLKSESLTIRYRFPCTVSGPRGYGGPRPVAPTANGRINGDQKSSVQGSGDRPRHSRFFAESRPSAILQRDRRWWHGLGGEFCG